MREGLLRVALCRQWVGRGGRAGGQQRNKSFVRDSDSGPSGCRLAPVTLKAEQGSNSGWPRDRNAIKLAKKTA
ncbi:unnamed protein product [Protopolystoma xenopodis]|uniref:Uncharacterized protein n=1 Tax=Protopolystoma xenopodis TaxID=117903 RepID=A0A448WKH3_9PLAT|nr:unnamed protein product [Protopolystoma xenopodis]